MPSHTLSERLKNKEEEEIEDEKSSNEEFESEGAESPVDFLISLVQGFIKNPESINTESLQDLLEGLMELRQEESPMPEKLKENRMNSHKGGESPDLVIMIERKIQEKKNGKFERRNK